MPLTDVKQRSGVNTVTGYQVGNGGDKTASGKMSCSGSMGNGKLGQGEGQRWREVVGF